MNSITAANIKRETHNIREHCTNATNPQTPVSNCAIHHHINFARYHFCFVVKLFGNAVQTSVRPGEFRVLAVLPLHFFHGVIPYGAELLCFLVIGATNGSA